MKLDSFVQSAYQAAKYHLEKIKEIVNSPSMQEFWHEDKGVDGSIRKLHQENIDKFHWHLRAYFWELVAAFETMLQWANQRYELGLEEKEVVWKNMPKKAGKDQSEWDNKHKVFESVWESPWFFEVRMYRNFAHRAFLFVQGEFDESESENAPAPKLSTLWLLHVREGQPNIGLVEQLESYIEKMRQLVFFKRK